MVVQDLTPYSVLCTLRFTVPPYSGSVLFLCLYLTCAIAVRTFASAVTVTTLWGIFANKVSGECAYRKTLFFPRSIALDTRFISVALLTFSAPQI